MLNFSTSFVSQHDALCFSGSSFRVNRVGGRCQRIPVLLSAERQPPELLHRQVRQRHLSNQSAASPRQEVRSRRHDYQRAIPGAPEIRPLTRTQHFTSNYSAISNSEREILQIIIGLIFFRIINFKREALYVTT